MNINSKAQQEFDVKRSAFVKYIKDKKISFSEKIFETKYRSFLRLKDGEPVQKDTYIGIIKEIEKSSKKIGSKVSSEIINKFKLKEKQDKSEIITFPFQKTSDFTNYIYHQWEQDQEEDLYNYKKRFLEYLRKIKFSKNKFINVNMDTSLISKCEESIQKNNEIRKKLENLLDIVTISFRYNHQGFNLKERTFLETDTKPILDYLFKENLKISIGSKSIPQPIKLKDNEIFLHMRFIWLIKFGDPPKVELNNVLKEEDIFKDFQNTYLS